MPSYNDETRRDQDADGVVHRLSDLGQHNRITFCERYEIGKDVYDTQDLTPTSLPLTCLRCITLPWRMWGGIL